MIQMGIDLGTNYIRLCTQEDGLLYNEPCMVALDGGSLTPLFTIDLKHSA